MHELGLLQKSPSEEGPKQSGQSVQEEASEDASEDADSHDAKHRNGENDPNAHNKDSSRAGAQLAGSTTAPAILPLGLFPEKLSQSPACRDQVDGTATGME